MNKNMYLQYTTETDKKLIKEALGFKDYKEAAKNGWVLIGIGASRRVLKKGRVVVKFNIVKNYRSHIREYNNYMKLSPHYRRHVARIFALGRSRVVQRYVSTIRESWTKAETRMAEKLIKKMNLGDVDVPSKSFIAHNIAICKGKPIIFDLDVEVMV
jgi:hypothetical protein